MKQTRKFALGCLTLTLAACGTQTPAPVVSGYSRMPWEPKLREVETPVAVQQAAQVQAQPTRLTTRVQTPAVAESMDLAMVEPAAGPVTTAPMAALQPRTTTVVAPQMTTYVVQPGETLYRIASQNRLKVAEVMAANNLMTSDIHAGDILLIPSKGTTTQQVAVTTVPVQAVQPQQQMVAAAQPATGQRYSLTRSRFENKTTAPVATTAVQPAQQQVVAVAPVQHQLAAIQPAAGATKPATTYAEVTYVAHNVQTGETLYRIGKQYGISPLDIMAANHLDRPQDLKAGTTLRIPVQGVQRTAQRQVDQQLAQAKGMVWPARGKVLSTYGSQGNGVTHTGINIQLPENTPIVAAETGTVIYADDGLKSYGNLVLLRHQDGLVTAYAHNNQLMVKKSQQVQKGEVIAYSGATGQVTSPQLHFEVRRNAQAINPLSVLPK